MASNAAARQHMVRARETHPIGMHSDTLPGAQTRVHARTHTHAHTHLVRCRVGQLARLVARRRRRLLDVLAHCSRRGLDLLPSSQRLLGHLLWLRTLVCVCLCI
jgi:hypothetical protein